MQTMDAKVSTNAQAMRLTLHKYDIVLTKKEDGVQAYVHDGKLPDDKYRYPWKRGGAESYQVLMKECATVFEDGAKVTPKEAGRINDIEPLDSQNGPVDESLSDAINFELDFDVVPSSNPSSPQNIFTPDEFFETYNEFDEIFGKENLDQFSTFYDSLKIDTVGNIDTTFSDAHQMKPSLSELSSKLETIQVEDPLLLNNEHAVTENDVFRLTTDRPSHIVSDVPMLQQKFDSSLFYESYMKATDDISEPKGILEDVYTDEYDWSVVESPYVESARILLSTTGPRTYLVIEEGLDIKYLLSKHIVKHPYEDLIQLERLNQDLSYEQSSTFLDINEIIVTEQDRFCEKAVLDVPVFQTSNLRNPHYVQQLLPKIEEVDIEMDEIWLLDCNAKQNLLQTFWQSEKYCSEIQACRLPEPRTSNHQLKRTDTLKQAKKVLGVLTDMNTGKAELALSWDIVKSIDRVTDPCRLLVPYVTDGEILKGHTAESERFAKYSYAEIHGTRLTTIDTKDETYDRPHNKASKVKSKVRPLNTSCDPLEAFMTLRSKTSVMDKRHAECVDSSIGQKTDISRVPNKKQIDDTQRQTLSNETKKKTKHHSVRIQLSEKLYQILELLQLASGNYLDKLKQCGELSTSATFLSISPDVSRFMLKQREKYMEDNKLDSLTDITFKLIVTLHGLVEAADLAVNCCLESAIGYMNALQEKYKTILEAELDPVRKKLFQMRATFYQNNILHPKVVSLCKEVELWLRNKRAKSKDCEQKIIVLIKHDMPSLMSCLKHALCLGNMLTPEVLSSTEPESIIRSLDQHNCLIAPCRMLTDSFPWAQFCLVVEYEYVEDSEWQQLCERQHIRHIGLNMHHKHETDITVTGKEWKPQYPDKQISVIGSTKITKSTDLLQLLEGGQNMLLVERDYCKIQDSKLLFFSDIDVDANTGIVLEDLKDIGDECTVQRLVTKMAALCLKYITCWLILFSSTKSESYIFQSHVISNIARMQADIANTVHHSSCASIKVLICNGFGEVASLIRNICENCMIAERNKPVSHWLSRAWLSEEISKEEMFLLMLPCLNSFSAQLLIDRLAMKKIFTMSANNLSQIVPEIDANIFMTLEVYVNSLTGLHLREIPFGGKCAENVLDGRASESNVDTPVAKLQKRRQEEYPTIHYKREEPNVDVTIKDKKSHYFKTQTSSMISKSYDTEEYAIEHANKQDLQSGKLGSDIREFTYRPVSDKRKAKKKAMKSARKDADMCYSSEADRLKNKSLKNTESGLFQNVISMQPLTTFEYNHGLPYIVSEPEINEFVPYKTSGNTVTDGWSSAQVESRNSGYSSGCRTYDNIDDLVQQFPSIENIDKSSNLETNNTIYCPEMDIMGIHASFKSHLDTMSPNSQFMLNQSHFTVDPSSMSKVQGSRFLGLKDGISNDDACNLEKEPSRINSQLHDCTDFHNRNANASFSTDTSTGNFNFQPKIIDTDFDIPGADGTNKRSQLVLGQQVYVNPQIKRLSRKQKLDTTIEGMVNVLPPSAHTSLADDLKETTRKVLENSQQFSRFELSSKRRPLQNMRIGLAQPLMREMKNDRTEAANVSAQDRRMMDKSLWTVGNSPPMDLDYESSSINDKPYTQKSHKDQEHNNFERSNKAVFTSQTPNKKRKLTFKSVAGRKGQTRLVLE